MQNNYNPKQKNNFDPNKIYYIVHTEWNSEYVDIIKDNCINTLTSHGINNVRTLVVPWSMELPYWSGIAFDKYWADVVIAIWVVIKWDTDHYKYVCDSATMWLMNVQLKFLKPVICGLLTCNTIDQVVARLNKWEEFALSALNISTL